MAMKREDVQNAAFECIRSKFKVKGDSNNFGVINGLDEKDVEKMLGEAVAKVSERMAQNGQKVTEEIIKKLCDVAHYDMLCAITQLTETQKSSEKSIKAAIRLNFEALSEKWGDFANRIFDEVQEISKRIPGLQDAIEQLSKKLENQVAETVVVEIGKIRDVVEEEGDKSAARDKKTQEMLLGVMGKLDDLGEKIQKNELKSDQSLIETLPQNDDFDLGWWYYCNGKYPEALNMFLKAAKENENHFRAQFLIGICYYNGYDGIEQNYNEAAKWLAMSAKSGFSEALLVLGDCYYHGLGVDQDYDSAFRYYLEAAQRHNANAMYCVGACYEHGHGVSPNILRAVDWYKKSAELGDEEGQFALGCCYYFEKGVVKDYRKAAELFFKAANSGHCIAQENYAECLEKGIGVSKDIEEAIKYYEFAAKQGSKEAEVAATKLRLLRKKQ